MAPWTAGLRSSTALGHPSKVMGMRRAEEAYTEHPSGRCRLLVRKLYMSVVP
jgi:hypothetical protein